MATGKVRSQKSEVGSTLPSSPFALPPLTVARIPYLNCAPFFAGLPLKPGWEVVDVAPRRLGQMAEEGKFLAGGMSLADYLRLQDRFERIGPLGVAVRGRVGSALLFSRKPLRQLDGACVAVTDETSTTALLLRVILEQRYHLTVRLAPHAHPTQQDADAVLLIGDEALRFGSVNRLYPFEIDVAFEWWLWQHLPCVFAVWAIRADAGASTKREVSEALQRTLAVNLRRLDELVIQPAASLHVPAEDLTMYLSRFIYRLSAEEERAIQRFAQLSQSMA